MNHTQNYQLSQWVKSDQVKMEDFNADNAKIDAAMKQEADARTALAAQVAKLGNCQILYMSYTGDGKITRTLTFPRRPLMVIGMSASYIFRAIQGAPNTMCRTNGFQGAQNCATTWSGNSLTWSGGGDEDGPNASGRLFYVAVFMDASE